MRIIITGDASRPLIGQHNNIRWLYCLIRHQLEALTGVKPECVYLAPYLSLEEWLKDESPHEWLKPYLTSDAIVIGFEMPKSMLRVLQDKKVPYMNIICYPLRFMDDLLLGVSTDILHNPHSRVNDLTIKVKASLMKAHFYHNSTLSIDPDTALVVQQTSVDRSVVKDGKAYTLDDFKEEISDLKNKHAHVLLKVHPSLYLGEQFYGLRIIDDNIYKVLSHDNISRVYGISSSVLYEAPYFDKPSTFWGNSWTERFCPHYGEDLLTIEFWQSVFRAYTLCCTEQLSLIQLNSRIRKTCSGYWGYKDIYP